MSRTAKPKGLFMDETPRTGGRVIPISKEERHARERLAACYRIFDYLGWTESIFNHITLRVPADSPTRTTGATSSRSWCATISR